MGNRVGATDAGTTSQDKTAIAQNIESQARYAQALFIWTDCDREGEHIGTEIRGLARRGNPSLEIKRARFSNIERELVSTIDLESWIVVNID